MKKIIIIIMILISLPCLAADRAEKKEPFKFTSDRIKEYKLVNGDKRDTQRTIKLNSKIINMMDLLRQSFILGAAPSRSLPGLEETNFKLLEKYQSIFESPELLALSDAPLVPNEEDDMKEYEEDYAKFKDEKKRGGDTSPYAALVALVHRAIACSDLPEFIGLASDLKVQILLDAAIDAYAGSCTAAIWQEMNTLVSSAPKAPEYVDITSYINAGSTYVTVAQELRAAGNLKDAGDNIVLATNEFKKAIEKLLPPIVPVKESLNPYVDNLVAQAFLEDSSVINNGSLKRMAVRYLDSSSRFLIPLLDNRLISRFGSGWVELFDLASKKKIAQFDGSEPYSAIAVSSDANVLITTTRSAHGIAIQQWNANDLTPIDRGPNELNVIAELGENAYAGVEFLSFTSDGKKIITSTYFRGREGQSPIALFITTIGGDSRRVEWPIKYGKMAFYPGAKENSRDAWIVTNGEKPHTIRQWELDGKEMPWQFDYRKPVTALAVSKDGRWIISGSTDGYIEVWDAHSGKKLSQDISQSNETELKRLANFGITALALSYDNKRIATVSRDGSVDLFTIEQQSDRRIKVNHAATLIDARSQFRMADPESATIAFSPDDKKLVFSCPSNSIEIYDMHDIDTVLSATKLLTLHQALLLNALVRGQVTVSTLTRQLKLIYDEFPPELKALFKSR
jgi:WD40 repeat protein